MGQYHVVVNLTKREFLNPHKMGDGLKLMEMSGDGGVATALVVLLAVSNGRGGGDAPETRIDGERIAGRWGADRIVVVGDYAERGDFRVRPGDPKPEDIYSLCLGEDATFRDITDFVCEYMSIDHGFFYVGKGWKERFSLWRDLSGISHTHGNFGKGRVVVAEGAGRARGVEFWQSDVIAAMGRAAAAREPRPFAMKTLVQKYGLKPMSATSEKE